MGLDITAYRKLTKLDVLFDADGEPINPATREPLDINYVHIYENHDFPGRAEGLEHKAVYAYQDTEHVMSMGYGRYNRWRDALAKLAGYQLTNFERFGVTEACHAAACWHGAKGPFSELINFSDCEGTIGPIVAAKLLKDFIDFDDVAKADAEFYAQYELLKKGLEMAADGGCLHFH